MQNVVSADRRPSPSSDKPKELTPQEHKIGPRCLWFLAVPFLKPSTKNENPKSRDTNA